MVRSKGRSPVTDASRAKPKYRVLRKLAEGGMAEVFLAEQIWPDKQVRHVALKRVLPRLRDQGAMAGMLEDEIELGHHYSHPNLVSTYGRGRADGHSFIVLEYVDGLDLAALFRLMNAEGRRFSTGDAVWIAQQMTSGLEHLHALCDDQGQPLGAIHRDVTPPNVLLGRNGDIKLCDFGFVRSKQQQTITEPGLIKGKFAYLSPEAAMGEDVVQASDLFAVGIVLWELLAMRRLFRGETDYDTVKMIQRAEVPTLASIGVEVPDSLWSIIERALAQKVSDRYESAASMRADLQGHFTEATLEADIPPLVEWGCEARERRGRASRAPKKASTAPKKAGKPPKKPSGKAPGKRAIG